MYAIDFGTSNTVVSRWNSVKNGPETISLKDLSIVESQSMPPLIPSLLYVEQAAAEVAQMEAIAGQAVRDRGLDLASDIRFFRNFKRGIGVPMQGFMPELDGHTLSFEQVGNCFLQRVISQLKAQDSAFNSLVFTVPVDSFEAYRLWLTSVCDSLDVEQIRLLDEPTAAALGYRLASDQQTLLVVDFGGGTLDMSLVQRPVSPSNANPMGFLLKWGQKKVETRLRRSGTVRVVAKVGQNLGGADVDRWIAQHFALEQDMPIDAITLRLSERVKIALSSELEASEAYFDEETLDSYDLRLGRDRLNEILTEQGFFKRLDDCLEQVLQQAKRQNITSEAVDAVLLVGGTAQIPAVQTWALSHFADEKIKCDRPFEAVSQGALRLQSTEVKDFLYHSYGIRYWDKRNNAHGWHPILEKGQPYPSTDPIELFLGASTEKQPSIELILGELGEQQTTTEVYFEGDQLVTRQSSSAATPSVKPLNDKEGARTVAQLSPPGFPGSDRVRILLSVDSDRFLRMTVEDLLTSETLMDDQVVVELT